MIDFISNAKIIIDGNDYSIDNLSDYGKSQLSSIKFVDDQISQLTGEWALANTARTGYLRALNRELAKD